jgi:hypothetical protein
MSTDPVAGPKGLLYTLQPSSKKGVISPFLRPFHACKVTIIPIAFGLHCLCNPIVPHVQNWTISRE